MDSTENSISIKSKSTTTKKSKSSLKKPEACLDVVEKKKRDQKEASKKAVVVKPNPEEKRPDARKDKNAGVHVKRARKATGTFTELPTDSLMAAKGPGGLDPYRHLYDRPQAPVVFTEGENNNDTNKMGVHNGIKPLFKTLLESHQPSGQSTILFPTLLQH